MAWSTEGEGEEVAQRRKGRWGLRDEDRKMWL